MNTLQPAIFRATLSIVPLLLLAGCGGRADQPGADPSPAGNLAPQGKSPSLAEARRGFQTKLLRQEKENDPVDEPPPDLFQVVHYDSPAGKLAAYLSRDPGDGRKHPAIVWIFGGFDNGIGSPAWEKATPDNDQSASAFREAGIVMMYPALRGGNGNPGVKEGFYGEVDDVLAADDFLARQEFVDPARIYLGGHSTGGTLALLAAESTDRFRAVFAFGPAEDVRGYGPDVLPFNLLDPREVELRSPGRWLDSIHSPTFVFEGTEQPGNLSSLTALAGASRNPLVHANPVGGFNHFSILAPVTRIIAGKIVQDTGPTTNITFTAEDLNIAPGR